MKLADILQDSDAKDKMIARGKPLETTRQQEIPLSDTTRRRGVLSLSPRFVGAIAALALAGPASADEPASLELIQTIPLQGAAGRLDHLAWDEKGNRLFLANLSNNSLDVVDVTAGKLVKQITNQKKIQGVAYVAGLDRIFVGNGADGVCNVFNGQDYQLLQSIKLPGADNVRYDASSRLIYVAHEENSLSAVDAATLEVKATIKLPGPPEAFQIDSQRSRIYVNVPEPAQVAVIDANKNEVIATHPLKLAGGNFPMALDAKNGRIFLGCRKPPKVVVLETMTGKEVAGIDIPAGIDDLFFDARRRRLYATCGEGYLTVIQERDGNRFEIIDKIAVPKLTRTCYFDAASDRLFVPIPRQVGQAGPTLRVYRPKD